MTFRPANFDPSIDPTANQVRALRDAAAYQALKAQKPAVMQKAQNAPRMPSKQAAPAQVRRDQAIEQKFKSGRAKLNDLAAFLR